MDDRELLELAAKAAGIKGEWDGCEFWLLGERTPDNDRTWNPRDRDGDALRLAVTLRIDIMFHGFDGLTAQSLRRIPEFPGDGAEFDGDDGDDFEATRRAIVRAAAEIGKAKP